MAWALLVVSWEKWVVQDLKSSNGSEKCHAFLMFSIIGTYDDNKLKIKMKKILLAILCTIFYLFPQITWSQAEYSNYYIEGDYSMHKGQDGELYYTLTNIDTKGITLGTGPYQSLTGRIGEDESVVFTFDTIVNNSPDGYKHIRFWKAKNNDGPIRWQVDSEVKKAESKKRTDMVKIVLLVLDCSNSLGSDFSELKKSAKEFIDILLNSSEFGNIRIGVIGFSNVSNTDNNVIPIQSLTSNSAKSIKESIDKLSQHNNTAMYYAMDKGERMVEEYVKGLDLGDDQQFGGAIMVTFTDGFDNHSLMEGRIYRKGLQNPYFQYVRDTVIRKNYSYTHKNVRQADGSRRDIVEEQPLESLMLVMKGNDVSEDDKTYQQVFNSLATDKPYYLKNFAEVRRKFSEVAELIVNSFQVLECYVPRAHEGRIRWTFDKPHGFLGVSFGPYTEISTLDNSHYDFGGTFSLDIGFPTKNYRAIGAFISGKIQPESNIKHFSFGMLYLGRKYHYRGGLLLGLGADIRFPGDRYNNVYTQNNQYWYEDEVGLGLALRIGFISKRSINGYIDLSMGSYSVYSYSYYKAKGPYHQMYYSLGICLGI